MSDKKSIQNKSTSNEVDAFLRKVASVPVIKASNQQGRLIFSMDATASRQPAWDSTSHIQAEMFEQTTALGGLAVQLCYYRGYGEFHATEWASSAQQLLKQMTAVQCRSGQTQIHRILNHTLTQTSKTKVNALVFIGDFVEENQRKLTEVAGKLSLYGTRAFMFQEGHDPEARSVFQKIAHITQGAYCSFDANSAQQLKDLLGAVAVYAAGGSHALEDYSRGKGQDVLRLTQQIGKS